MGGMLEMTFNNVLSQELGKLREALASEHRRTLAQREQELLQQIDVLRQELKRCRGSADGDDTQQLDPKMLEVETLSATPQKTPSSVSSPGRSETDVGHATPPKSLPLSHIRQTSINHKCDRDIVRIIQSAQVMVESCPVEKSMGKGEDDSQVAFIDAVLDPVVCFVIVLHMALMGVSLDANPTWEGWLWLESIFGGAYTFEILAKLWLLGFRRYICGKGAVWNVVDALLVVVAVTHLALRLTGRDTMPMWEILLSLRIMRPSRVKHLTSILREAAVDEMHATLTAFRIGVRSLIWACALLLLPMYILAMLVTSFIGKQDDNPFVVESFSSLPRSLLAVFRCSIGDCSFSNGAPAIAYIVDAHGWVYAVVYVLMVVLTTLGIFGLMVGAFVNAVLATTNKDEATRLRSRLSDASVQTRRASDLIYKLWQWQRSKLANVGAAYMPADLSTMSVQKEDFESVMADPEVQEILDDLDVPTDDRHRLFDVLDADEEGMLRMDELVSGIIKLRGGTRRSDVVHASLMCRSMRRDLDSFRIEVLHLLRSAKSNPGSTEPGATDAIERSDVSRSSSTWSGSSAQCNWRLPRPPLAAMTRAPFGDAAFGQDADRSARTNSGADSLQEASDFWAEVCRDLGASMDSPRGARERPVPGPRLVASPPLRHVVDKVVVDMVGMVDAEIPAPLCFPAHGPSHPIANKDAADPKLFACPQVPSVQEPIARTD